MKRIGLSAAVMAGFLLMLSATSAIAGGDHDPGAGLHDHGDNVFHDHATGDLFRDNAGTLVHYHGANVFHDHESGNLFTDNGGKLLHDHGAAILHDHATDTLLHNHGGGVLHDHKAPSGEYGDHAGKKPGGHDHGDVNQHQSQDQLQHQSQSQQTMVKAGGDRNITIVAPVVVGAFGASRAAGCSTCDHRRKRVVIPVIKNGGGGTAIPSDWCPPNQYRDYKTKACRE